MAKKKYKLVAGGHEQYEKTKEGVQLVRYHATDNAIVESEKDLTAMFPGKFVEEHYRETTKGKSIPRKNSAAATTTPEPSTTTPAPEETPETPDNETEITAVKLGENVSEDFPKAQENDFLVFTEGGWYQVYDKEEFNPEAPVKVNEKGLRKDDVEKFIEDFLS